MRKEGEGKMGLDEVIISKAIIERFTRKFSEGLEMANLHVDPLAVRARFVVDATGHPAEVVQVLQRKNRVSLTTPSGSFHGERSLWAEMAERSTVENTGEIYPGLYVAGMAVNATMGGYRMGPIFGGMLFSGEKVARLILERLRAEKKM